MYIFTRSKDLVDYTNKLTSIIEEMAKDMVDISGCEKITVDELIKSYMKSQEAPNVFEDIMIKNGRYTLEEAKRNILVEYMKARRQNK